MTQEKILQYLPALCNQIRRIAIEAGELTLDYFDESGFSKASQKSDGSPVTEADQAAEKHIKKALLEITPSVPFIGEESVESGQIPDLTQSEYFWLVDPIDGTRAFIAGEDDFTVNIALIHNNIPVLGVIYAPIKGELFAAHGEHTAIRWSEETDKEKWIKARQPSMSGLTVVTSNFHGTGAKLDTFLSEYKVKKRIKKSSSIKFCMIAAGKADMYPRLGPTSEWDTAAGDAILRGAGGQITDMEGHPLIYGKREQNFINPGFIASASFKEEQTKENT